LNKCRPEVIAGFVSLLRLGALALRDAGAKLEFTPKAVIAHSETLYPEDRDLLAETFGAPIYSRSGAREFGAWVAQNCPEQVRAYERGPDFTSTPCAASSRWSTRSGGPGLPVRPVVFSSPT